MICPKCGTNNIDGSSFCVKCGLNLRETQNIQRMNSQQLNQINDNTIQNMQNMNSQQLNQINDNTIQNMQNMNSQQLNQINDNTIQNMQNMNSQQLNQTVGNIFKEVSSQSINDTPIKSENNFQTNVAPTQPVNISTNTVSSTKVTFMGYFFIILAVILKPFTAFKEELNKFNSFKNSAIMTLIITVIGTLINLITTMFNSVMVKSFDWTSGKYKTTWAWEKLKEIKYLEVIGKNFLIYLGIIIAIAAVYYIASLIVKKQTIFSRLLVISAIATVPMLICSLVISPLLTLIWDELSMPVTLIGAIYTIVLIYEGMNDEILIDKNAKYYFNFICLSILGIVGYYLGMKMFMSSIKSELDGLEDLTNMFG